MTTRRKFVKNSVIAGAAMSAGVPSFALQGRGNRTSNRPETKLRKFRSRAVEDTISEI
ncbi:MAG: twin-arginine translocation signal domain-containing protein, partial [Bacteroidales bacterium]|nr:twin-arginine translocation signal domain-containing protein [Bacteroidales bacterium]